jgi:Kef-type K+ transport system membrane component KefB
MSFEFTLAPGGGVPVSHVHRFQEERYHVLEGTFAFRIRRTRIEFGAGRSLAVRPGPHRLWNPTDRDARMVIEVRPALRMEDLFVDLWALARSRRTNRWGIPRDPLLAGLVGHAYLREGVLPVVPAWVQRGCRWRRSPAWPGCSGTGCRRSWGRNAGRRGRDSKPMPDVSFSGLLIVSAVAFASPLVLGLFPKVKIPSAVFEIVLGIVIGPSVLNWVQPDLVIQVVALVGLAFLLFLAGLEVDVTRLRGRVLRLTTTGFVISLALGLAIGFALHAAGQVQSAVLVGIILAATSLGLVAAVLKDAGETTSQFGLLVIAGSTIADFGAVILLSLLFSKESSGGGTKLILLGMFVLLIAAVGYAVARAGRSMRLTEVLNRLQDTTAQIRVRGAMVLLLAFVALAENFGLETILGAFMAGAVLSLVDRDRTMTHPNFRLKLEAMGFGLFIPVFFVSSGLSFNLSALFSSASTILRIPVFLAALLVVRGVPALLYRSVVDRRRVVAAALLQATSLPFIVAATQIGLALGKVSEASAAALVAAGLLSVVLFPVLALSMLRRAAAEDAGAAGDPATPRRPSDEAVEPGAL